MRQLREMESSRLQQQSPALRGLRGPQRVLLGRPHHRGRPLGGERQGEPLEAPVPDSVVLERLVASMIELRYVFDSEPPSVIEVKGDRCKKVVKVIPSMATLYRNRITVAEWDAMAMCPRTAQRRFLLNTQHSIDTHTRRCLELHDVLNTCGRPIESYPILKSKRTP